MSDDLKLLHVGSNCSIFLDNDPQAKTTIALKVIRSDLPKPEQLAQLKNEFDISRQLGLANCRRVIKETTVNGRPGLVMEYIKGLPLNQYLERTRPDLGAALRLAIEIISAVGALHHREVIHKDINPSNILVAEEDGSVHIIDFGLSTRTNMKSRHLDPPDALEGTLKYISPEQTGRMNRVVDYRTDFYSFGVMLYEMVTGRPPFDAKEPITLIYSHIASTPAPPDELNSAIGPALSAVILKLLSKNAEDRYQSADGILHDLETCLDGDTAGVAFTPGAFERSGRFCIPEKLYGRSTERQILLDTFERVCEYGSEMMLVTGYSGVGKSSLVYEINQSLAAASANFISGKYDQYQKNIPYSALVQAIEVYINQVLTASEDRFNTVREGILKAVGKNGRVLVDLVPSMALIIGSQPPAPELGAKESENRLHLVFQNFIGAISSPAHPLVMFIDDLQWVDLSSLTLFKLLLEGSVRNHLFFIGAFRDNEVSQAHPLMQMIRDVKQGRETINEIQLKNLLEKDVLSLVADVFNTDPAKVGPLADMIFEKTRGNPFYTRILLSSIHKDRLVTFSRKENLWCWDMTAIREKEYSRNVVDLLCRRISTLAAETRDIIQKAACIGNQFDLNTLSVICKKTVREILNGIWPGVSSGILEFLDNGYKLVDVQPDVNSTVRFVHDRIQQAALVMLPETEREKIHLKIGRLLLSGKTGEGKQLFVIVDQLNQGRRYLVENDIKRIAGLNLSAGIQASAATAYEAALGYLETGLELLGDARWEREYSLTLALHTQAAQAAYLNGDFEKVTAFSSAVLEKAGSLADRMKIHLIQMEALIAQGLWLPSIEHAVTVLRGLNIDLPDPDGADFPAILKGLETTEKLIGGKPPEALIDLPEMTDPSLLSAMEMLTISLPAAYIAVPNMFPLIVSKMISLCIAHGNAPMSTLAYANYGVVLCAVAGNTDLGYRYGQLALMLLDRLDADAYKARTINNVNVFLTHWQTPLADTISPLRDAYYTGLETGDLVFAGYSINAHNYHSFFTGVRLDDLESDLIHFGQALLNIAQEGTYHWNEIHHQTVLNLTDPEGNPDPCKLKGRAFDEEAMIPVHEQNNDMVGLFYIYLYKMILCYFFHDYAGAAAAGENAQKYLAGASGMPLGPIFYFYDALVQLGRYEEIRDDKIRKEIREQVAANAEKLHKWSETGTVNYLHKYYLIKAESYRFSADAVESREYYDKAISRARAHGYTNEEALANELAGNYYLKRDMFQQARLYLNNAILGYGRWGARAKVSHMTRVYTHLLHTDPGTGMDSTLGGSTTGSEINDFIDFETILTAFKAISKEIILDRLLQTLMETVLVNSGADKGYFLSVIDNEYKMEALCVLTSGSVEHLTENTPNPVILPDSIIRYVHRTKERVLINNSESENDYSSQYFRDPYFDDHHPKSVLCMPIIRQSEINGILYLENGLAYGVFTERRVKVLDMLSAQIAISLENARVHKNLEKLVDKRTHTLNEKNQELEAITVELKHVNRKLEKLASEDPLTGLFNRRQVFSAGEILVKNAIRAQTAVSVFMLDIDFFKPYNDTYGHQAGDLCLKKVSSAINRLFQRSNDIVGRYGGEEFVGILFDVGGDDMLKVAGKLCAKIKDLDIPHTASGISRVVTASVGFTTVIPGDGTELDDLIKTADRALYKAKSNGRNQAVALTHCTH